MYLALMAFGNLILFMLLLSSGDKVLAAAAYISLVVFVAVTYVVEQLKKD